MTLTVRELLGQPQLQLTLLAGQGGLDRKIEWAHTCDLPDPWMWVGAHQILLTNGSTLPAESTRQREWAGRLAVAGVVAIGIGDDMGGPELTGDLLECCEELKLPLFTIPYPLPFTAVAQAVAESATALRTQRLHLIARLYEFTGKDLLTSYSGPELIQTIEGLVEHDIAVVDAHCFHSWFHHVPIPAWLAGAVRDESARHDVAGIWMTADGGLAHAVRLAAMPGAIGVFRPHSDSIADQSLLMHAASVLGAALSRRAALELQENRRHVEYINRIILDQDRFNLESEGWMRQLGYHGTVHGVALVGGSPDDRESVVRRLQRHGVKLSATLQNDRHLIVAQHHNLTMTIEHALEGQITAGMGSAVDTGQIHQSLKEASWALLMAEDWRHGPVSEFMPGRSWMGFHDPHDGEDFVQKTLGGLLDETSMRRELLKTLRVYLKEDRSPQRTAQAMTVHRQTVIQRLRKIENLLGTTLSSTDVIARVWIALMIHDALHGTPHLG